MTEGRTLSVPPPTDRVRFRGYRDADAALVERMFSDSAARLFYPTMIDRQAARTWIAWNLRSYEENGFGLWVIEERSTGEFLGDCGLTYQMPEGQRMIELGYHLDAGRRGEGLATEAGAACLDHGFDRMLLPLVCSMVNPANSASIAVAARLHRHRTDYVGKDGRPGILFWTEASDRLVGEVPT